MLQSFAVLAQDWGHDLYMDCGMHTIRSDDRLHIKHHILRLGQGRMTDAACRQDANATKTPAHAAQLVLYEAAYRCEMDRPGWLDLIVSSARPLQQSCC